MGGERLYKHRIYFGFRRKTFNYHGIKIVFMGLHNLVELVSSDKSSKNLIYSNLVTIVLAIVQDWNMLILMWIYLAQSVIIGGFNVVRILTLKNYETEGFTMGGNEVEAIWKTNISVAAFFLVHFGIFHMVYAGFLFAFSQLIKPPTTADLPFMILAVAVFFANHMSSFFAKVKLDSMKKPNIGHIMFMPYIRILPMHFTILFGGFIFFGGSFAQGGAYLVGGEYAENIVKIVWGRIVVTFFLILKTSADVISHITEHEPEKTKNIFKGR